MIGQNIAHYRVSAKLGAGGMGEVYRASDTKLGRDVALKVLPAAFASDTERMARFQREAQVLASLNHPNIAAIYGLEEGGAASSAPTTRALVMELVEGPTLAERIASGPLAIEDVLQFAKQIAEGLEYAHERGIIHRDLKPANVKVTSEGKVKILDFGLAKALAGDSVAQDASHSPTLSIAATKAGIVLGTAAYMSPEQARGKAADRRADIWSFGVVLYEMLSGKQVFGGETASDSMAAVITREPDWNALPTNVPPRIRELLRRCLTKDSRRRLQAIGDARNVIEEVLEHPEIETGIGMEAMAGPMPAAPAWRRALPWALVVVALAAGAGLTAMFRPAPAPNPVARVTQTLPVETALTGRNRVVLAISPDGSKVAYAANQRLYLRSLDSLTAVELPGTEAASSPFFSPDGQWVGFFAGGQTKKTQIAGGTPTTVCTKDGFDASWAPNGTILIGAAFAGILGVPAQGGAPSVLVAPEPGKIYLKPVALPDGKSFLYISGTLGGYTEWDVVMRSFQKEDNTVVLRGANHVFYSPTGHLVYARLSDLYAVGFDPGSRRVLGNAVRVVQNVDYANAAATSHFAFSNNGTLVYLAEQGAPGLKSRIVSVDRAGKVTVLPIDVRDFSDPKVSPDGRMVAAHVQDAQNDIWVADPTRGTMSRLSFDPSEDETPLWSPDGRTIMWTATRSGIARGIFRRAADGSGKEELVWTLDKHAHLRDWLPDGKAIILEVQDSKTGTDIWRLDLGEKPTATPYLQTEFNERNSRLSPDGRWMVYNSDESGKEEVYIQSFPAAGAKVQVSSKGGDQPAWARNGKSVFYRGENAIQEVSFESSPRLAVGKPRVLFPDHFESPQVGGHTGYDVFPDGRFLMIQSPDARLSSGAARYDFVFVFNWFEEVKRLALAGK
ncbi:MAG: serine/threonine-protein kinase [Acidobacteria bacterium]|nr:serine/threonine-protein kinase [Acidobacteriota bacterium]MCL5287147.1 serine/threonine-protein kinase [Acidobacteriota bacterium]